MATDVSSRAKRRKGSKHDRMGCLTCRYRHKKCVENTFPVCGACMRLNLECLREPKRQVAAVAGAGVQTRAAKARTEPAMSLVPVSLARKLHFFAGDHPRSAMGIDSERCSTRQYAMKYYVNVMTQLLTVSHQHNSFLSEFVPMAVESPALSGALVSWASGHLSTLDSRYRITALEARSTALRQLAEALSCDPNDISIHETNAATCLVLLTSEVCLGNYAAWYGHLVGAKNVIMSARYSATAGEPLIGPAALKGSVEGRWILRNFAYHDILGSVTLGTKPLLSTEYLGDITGVVDTYLGVASGILILIAEISCLDPAIDMKDSGSECAEIEQRLNAWQCHSAKAPALVALGYAYRSAALIYLYRRMRSFTRLRTEIANPSFHHRSELLGILVSKLSSEATATLEHVAKIPTAEIADSALLFPLFLAGGEVVKTTEINFVRQRLQLMLEKRHFQNIERALLILEEVWDRRLREPNTPGSENADWQKVLTGQRGPLLLT